MLVENIESDRFSSIEFYQKQYYLQLESEILNGIPVYYKLEDENGVFIIPLIKRIIEKDYYDLISPYGYPGFITTNNSPNYVMECLNLFNIYCKNNNIITSFLRLHPFNNYIFPESNNVVQIMHGKVIFFSLERKYEELYSNYSSNHKRGIKKLKNQGFSIRLGDATDIQKFISIYNETMQRLNAKEFYYFDERYYTELLRNDQCKLVFVESPDKILCSAALFVFSSEYIQYHLGGTLSEFLHDAPIKLIFDFIIKSYSQTNLKFNLGGGLGGSEDSLFQFKAGFSHEKIKFSTVRMIHNQDVYNNLTSKFEKTERNDITGFFPLYRKQKL